MAELPGVAVRDLLGGVGTWPQILGVSAVLQVLMLALMCRDGRLDFTDLLVPLFLLIGGWHVRDGKRRCRGTSP